MEEGLKLAVTLIGEKPIDNNTNKLSQGTSNHENAFSYRYWYERTFPLFVKNESFYDTVMKLRITVLVLLALSPTIGMIVGLNIYLLVRVGSRRHSRRHEANRLRQQFGARPVRNQNPYLPMRRANTTYHHRPHKKLEPEVQFDGPIGYPAPNATRSSNLLDAALNLELPLLYPARLPEARKSSFVPEIQYAEWTMHLYSNVSNTLLGRWPRVISNLTFLPIKKNGHTALLNGFGDLREHLRGNVTVISKGKEPELVQKLLNNSGLRIAVLRDPIDRYLSGTCEDWRQRIGRFSKINCIVDGPKNVQDCVRWQIDYIKRPNVTRHAGMSRGPRFSHHQVPQFIQLKGAMNGVDLPVAIVHFSQLGQLLKDIHATDTRKMRDRTDSSYLEEVAVERQKKQRMRAGLDDADVHAPLQRRWTEPLQALALFCKLKANELEPDIVEQLCLIYRQDVAMMQAVGFAVPLCERK
jgi:hypothetical protein